MKRFLLIAAILFSLLLALPLAQKGTGLLPAVPLSGVENTAQRPKPSLSAWWNGTLQPEVDAWVNQHIGWRGAFVRTANQINFTLFGEFPKREGTQALMGRQGVLFEGVYVWAYNENGGRPGSELRNISSSTRRLQDYLAADGIVFLLVIAPSKAEIYSEHLPKIADVAGRPDRRSNYQNIIPYLREDGVNLVDAHELFLEWKRAPNAPLLFSKGGTHWNHYGAARVVEQIVQRLRDLTGKDLPSIRVVGSTTNQTVVGEDNDLGEIMNLWARHRLAGPQIHPVIEKLPGTHMPNILFVGDSFVFTLTNLMDREGLYRKRDTYYYYNRQYFYPEAPKVALDKRQLDLLEELRGRDAVVVEVNEYWLPRIGFGFVRDLLKAYDRLNAAKTAENAS